MEIASELGSSAGLSTLGRMYGFTINAAQFAVEHIDVLKHADNALANRVGQVLEAASKGFGVGNETALVLIGLGQALLGNPLSGGVAVAGALNPVVVTCAAVGAIHYGWKAMDDREREAILAAVGAAFKLGVEFIRSVANFAYDTIKALMSAENVAELKRMVAEAAAAFGRRLSEITKALSDRASEITGYAVESVESAASTAWSYVPTIRRIASVADQEAGAPPTVPGPSATN